MPDLASPVLAPDEERTASCPQTFAELLGTAAAAAGADRFLLWGEGGSMSFSEFDLEARRFAGGLRARGIGKGERVAVLMDNRPEILVAIYGALLNGSVFVPINTHLTAAEASYIASHAGARVLASEPRCLRRLGEMSPWPELEFLVTAEPRKGAPAGPVPASFGIHGFRWTEFLAESVDPASVDVRGDDLAAIQYTSGTTASPKGALHTHRTLLTAFCARGRHLGYTPADTMLVVTPLFHLNAQGVVIMALRSCFRVVLKEKFSASRFWDDVRRHGVTTINGLLTIPRILLAREHEPGERDHPLRTVVGVVGPQLHRTFEERFGVTLVPAYGLTEDPMPVLGPSGGFRGAWSDKVASTGRPVDPEVHAIRIVGEHEEDLPPGATGEIVKRSPATMSGYFEDPEATAAVLEDGWLRTGDLGYLDEDGFLYFVGRKKDAVRRCGEMIAAAEVEAAISSHPAVAEAAVVGVPDPIRGEEVKAFIVLAEGRSRDEVPPEDVLEHCARRLAPFKLPRYIEYRDDLPRTPTLKVRKEDLRGVEALGKTSNRLNVDDIEEQHDG